MKRILFTAVLARVLFAPLPAWASDAAIGVHLSSFSTQLQVDYTVARHVGIQGGVGEMLFMDDLSLSAGARWYFVPRKVTPYVGGLYRTFERHYVDRWGDHHHGMNDHLVGPTLGLRARKWRGIGAFGQVELMTHVGSDEAHYHDGHDHHDDDHHWHTGLTLGVQWWF